MEIVKQTPGRLVVVHSSAGETKALAALGALVFVGACGLFAACLIQGIGSGSAFESFVCALMILFCLLPVGLCLNALLLRQVFDFDRDLDRFVISDRWLFGRTETAGRVSRILSIKHKLDFSGTSVDTGPSSEIALRYDDGAGSATKTATFGLGMADDDRRLQQTLKAFLKL